MRFARYHVFTGILLMVLVAGSLREATAQRIDASEKPSKLVLHQNYPNPFNPATTIRFDLSEPGFAVLTVHDLLGEEVSRLISGHLSEGRHLADWHAGGRSSGIYFYRLQVGNEVATRKMVLLE